MKKIILSGSSIVFIFLIACGSKAHSQTELSSKKTNVELEGLTGKVKQIKVGYYTAVEKNGSIVQGEKAGFEGMDEDYTPSNYLKIFNEKGNTVEFKDFDVNSHFKYIYNDIGNIIEENEYDEKGNVISKTSYKYDDKGKILEKNYSYNGKITSSSIYKYDTNGNLIEWSDYYEDRKSVV